MRLVIRRATLAARCAVPVGYHDPSGSAPEQQRPDRPDLGPIGNRIRNKLTSDTEKSYFERYWNSEGDLHLTAQQFQAIVSEAERLGQNGKPGKCMLIDGTWYIQRSVNLYGSPEYRYASGVGTLYYDEYDEQATRFEDSYNFDWKKWGTRSPSAERATRMVSIAGTLHGATPFNISFP